MKDEALASIKVGMDDDDTQEEIREKVDHIAEHFVEEAKRDAPVGTEADHDAAPGTFRDSIKWKRLPGKKAPGSSERMPAARVYSDAVNPSGHHYSQYVEYGSRGHKGAGVFGATAKRIQREVDEDRLKEESGEE